MHPLLILLLGMVIVLGAIARYKVNAFLALIAAACVVGLVIPGDSAVHLAGVAEGFGRTAGNVGIVIALASVVGSAMTASRAADRIVHGFLSLLGEKRAATALCATGFVLSIPVFFDTVFYLLIPLARSMHTRTRRDFLKYILAISAGGVATHTLVPPTPGPLAVADTLGVDLGLMILVGFAVALPGAVVGMLFATWIARRLPRDTGLTGEAAPVPDESDPMPGLVVAAAPVILPMLLISASTIASSLAKTGSAVAQSLVPVTSTLGNPNFALLLSAALAVWVYWHQRRPTAVAMATLVEESLMSAGMIILIVAAGGAFGAMLQAAQVGPSIQGIVVGDGGQAGPILLLLLAFGVALVLKVAQGSSTVAMITTAGMMQATLAGVTLPFHVVYVATAIAGGSLVGSWMNDAGFWVFSRLGLVSEIDTLRTWTPLLALVGVASMATTLLLSQLVPLR